MIDLHTHILPGMDDGSRDMDSSLEMAVLALEGGVDRLAATPHSNQLGRFENFFSERFYRRLETFRHVLKEEGIPLTVYSGMEIFASYDMGEHIRRGELISLNHSRYYLVEFEFDESPEEIRGLLKQIFAAGGVPLIAHPERYFCLQDEPELAYEWIQMGCLTQVNRGSLLGRFGQHARSAAKVLLENGLVTCVASDAHSPRVRTTFMEDIQYYLADRYGEDVMHRLLVENPKRIITDQTIPPHGQRPERSRRYF